MWTRRPVPVPANQLLGREAQTDHDELEVEPVRLEPEEQVDAEDHRKGTEAEHVASTPRPAEQHVERVREDQLRGDERRGS